MRERREIEREREKLWDHPSAADSLVKCLQQLRLSQTNVRTVIWVSCMGTGAQAFGETFTAFPGALYGNWIRSSQNLNWSPYGRSTSQSTAMVPQQCSLKEESRVNSNVFIVYSWNVTGKQERSGGGLNKNEVRMHSWVDHISHA